MVGRRPTSMVLLKILPPSSSGLGHPPFKQATRVRIPSGVLYV